MKVYSWKTLFISIIFGGGVNVYILCHFGGPHDLIWLCFFGYLTAKGLRVSFVQAAYEEDLRRGDLSKKVCRKLFGKLAPVIPYSPIIILFFGAMIGKFLPTFWWITLVCVVVTVVSGVFLSYIIRKHMALEEFEEENKK